MFPTTGSRYLTSSPPAALSPFVECLWTRTVAGAGPGEDRRILPDGRIDLVWIPGTGTLVAGPQSRHTRRPVPGPLLAVGARFRPGFAPELLRTRAAELVDEYVPLDALRPALASGLDGTLARARDPLAALEEELTRALDGLPVPDPAVQEATHLLAGGSASVAEVAARVYVSERQLERRFAERVGYGPKTFQRIVRFQRAVAQLRGGGAGLARAALSAGYADQPHLTRESRRLSGLTPRQLVGWLG